MALDTMKELSMKRLPIGSHVVGAFIMPCGICFYCLKLMAMTSDSAEGNTIFMGLARMKLIAHFTMCHPLIDKDEFKSQVTCKVVLEAAILTAAIFLSLTLYTFWAARTGHDFNFLGPFLFASLLTLVVFGVIQIFLPLGKISHLIYGIVGILVFCGYIVYDTDELIKRYQYDGYILAAIDLYLDLLDLFLKILEVMKDVESSDDA